MALWFRFYEGALDDPKVQKLPPKMFKAWINLLCLASRHDGEIPEASVIAFALRISEVEATDTFAFLFNSGLFDRDTDGRVTPHNWASRQFKSDVSNERVKRHRERQRNVTVTPSEQSRDRTDIPLAKANGHSPSKTEDISAIVFGVGLRWLVQSTGKSDTVCRSLLGKWRQQSGDEALISALGRAQRESPIDAVAWMTKALKPADDKPKGWN